MKEKDRNVINRPEAFLQQEKTEKLQLKLGGLSCSFCVASITKALLRMDGVREVDVNLAHEEGLIEYDPSKVSPTQLKETLIDLGYIVRDAEKVRTFEEEEEELKNERDNLLLAAGFSAVAVGAMVLMWFDFLPSLTFFFWLMPILALSTIFGPGWRILTMAWASLRRGILNQHVLLEFGAFAGLLGGFLGYLSFDFPLPDFFGIAVFVTTYHLLSGYVSLRVRTRSSQAVRKLLALVPPTARVVRNGLEKEIPIEQVQVGDRVRVRPGELIPVDGEIMEGVSGVDQSLVTGEAIPEEKGPGEKVIGGSINQTGTLLVRATKVGEESFLQQVARQVEEARALKPGILALVDRVLQVYVPGVLTFAGAALLIWTLGAWGVTGAPNWTRALFATLAVLVMGYPCALGMATPLAMIRGGGLAAGAEAFSEHPLARAVAAAAEIHALPIPAAQGFQATPGKGITAVIEGYKVTVGKPSFIESQGIDLGSACEQIKEMQSAGHTVVALAIDGESAALIAIADQIKPDAKEAIERLQSAGLAPVMLTGDNSRTAKAVAEQVGIAEYRAEVLPKDKANVVRDLQRQGFRVAMVGDGINDAPALMQADVGIAIGAGTDIAIESADIILVGERLGAVVDAYHISKASYRKTVQNLSLAFSFNGIGVPLATTGLVHPVWAMIAMVASVSTVLTNSFAGRLMPTSRRGRSAQLTLKIANMHCEGCLSSIKEAASKLEGVKEVTGDPAKKVVTVTYREGVVEPDGIREAIIERGFQVV